MNRLTYNASILVGLGAVTAGVAWQWGPAIGLITFGALVIGLTLFVAAMIGGR